MYHVSSLLLYRRVRCVIRACVCIFEAPILTSILIKFSEVFHGFRAVTNHDGEKILHIKNYLTFKVTFNC